MKHVGTKSDAKSVVTQDQLGFDNLTVNSAATGTVTLNLATASVFDITLTGNTTIAFSNIPAPTNQSFSWVLRVTCGATGYSITWPAVTWLTTGDTAPPAPLAGKVVEYVFSTQNGTLVLGRKGSAT